MFSVEGRSPDNLQELPVRLATNQTLQKACKGRGGAIVFSACTEQRSLRAAAFHGLSKC